MLQIRYKASPTARQFHQDGSFFRGLMGPIGSVKLVVCCAEIFNRANHAGPHAGVRRARWAVIRNTFPQLRTTTIKTWLDWSPEGQITHMNWSPPCTGTLRMPLPDGSQMELELLFVSLDKPRDVGKVLSLELTGAWLNEAREIPKAIPRDL